MTVEQRKQHAMVFKPELASLNMGSMNSGFYPMLNRFSEFTHVWEWQYLENSRDLVFKNTFSDIEKIRVGDDKGTRHEFDCYDISHLHNLAHFVDSCLAKKPLSIQSVFGLLDGIGGHLEDLVHMNRTADRLFYDDNKWSISGARCSQFPMASVRLARHRVLTCRYSIDHAVARKIAPVLVRSL